MNDSVFSGRTLAWLLGIGIACFAGMMLLFTLGSELFPTSSIQPSTYSKSAIGHLLGAAGAVEAIFSILAIRDNIVPPTLNLDNPSVETAIDLVPHVAKKREINTALSNSFGFGGTNASVIVQRVVN